MGERACYAVSSVNRACINERGDEGKEDLLRLPQAEYTCLGWASGRRRCRWLTFKPGQRLRGEHTIYV